MKNDKVNMVSGPITRSLLRMTLPIMVMNVLQSIFNIIDMTVLRYFADEGAVGAAGASGTLITLSTSLMIGLAAGANVVVAKLTGAGSRDRANRAAATSVLMALTGGFALMIIGAIFAKTFLVITNCPDTLLKQATAYFRIYFYSLPALMLYNYCASVLRALGDTRRPMVLLILGGIVKVAFNFLFVAVLGMSVRGAALATVVSNSVSGLLALVTLLRSRDVIHVDLKKLRFDLAELKEILYIGVPAGCQDALYSLANVVIAAAVNSFGADATTGIAIANQFDGILYQIITATSLATIPYIAQNVGAGNIARVKKTTLRAVLITTVFGVVFGSFSVIFSRQLSSIMSSSEAVIEYSRQKMVVISGTYFICGINNVMGGVLKGMRKPLAPTISTLIYMCLLRFVWVCAIFPHFPNMTFLYTVWPVGWILSIITLLIVYIPAVGKLERAAATQGGEC